VAGLFWAVLVPCFLSLSLSWVLSFHKVWQGFIIIEKRAENKVIGKVG
jgi:hypothetical protein